MKLKQRVLLMKLNVKSTLKKLFDDLLARRRNFRLERENQQLKYDIERLEHKLARSKKAESDSVAALKRIRGTFMFAKHQYEKLVEETAFAELQFCAVHIERGGKEINFKHLSQHTGTIIYGVRKYHRELSNALGIEDYWEQPHD